MPAGQHFKAVYFSDQNSSNSKTRGLTLAFGEKNSDLYKKISDMESNEIRQALGTDSMAVLEDRAEQEGLSLNTYCLWYLRKQILLPGFPSVSRKDRVDVSKFINKVIQGDCLEVMEDLPTASIDMILCDLPYGTTQNPWDSVIPLDRLWHNYERIIKDDGVIALTGQGLFTAQLMLSNPRMYKYKLTWIKSKPTNFLNAKKQPLRKHEDIVIFYKKQPAYFPQMSYGEPYNKGVRKDQLTGSYGDFKTVEVKSNGERYPTDVIYFKTAESEGDVYHPTQKPVGLGRYLIKSYTHEGDIVLDNTCGSGSFLVAAVLEGRKFIGIEKNHEVYQFKKEKINYIEVANRRIKEAVLLRAMESRMQRLL